MTDFVRTCNDGHRCEHGSQCVEDPNNEGSYSCDCSVANGDYAGLYCEYEAEEYCTFPQEVSGTWFCTNGGTCVANVSPQSSSFKCDCQDDFYEGTVRIIYDARKKLISFDYLNVLFESFPIAIL